jgi:hypothetical protein
MIQRRIPNAVVAFVGEESPTDDDFSDDEADELACDAFSLTGTGIARGISIASFRAAIGGAF